MGSEGSAKCLKRDELKLLEMAVSASREPMSIATVCERPPENSASFDPGLDYDLLCRFKKIQDGKSDQLCVDDSSKNSEASLQALKVRVASQASYLFAKRGAKEELLKQPMLTQVLVNESDEFRVKVHATRMMLLEDIFEVAGLGCAIRDSNAKQGALVGLGDLVTWPFQKIAQKIADGDAVDFFTSQNMELVEEISLDRLEAFEVYLQELGGIGASDPHPENAEEVLRRFNSAFALAQKRLEKSSDWPRMKVNQVCDLGLVSAEHFLKEELPLELMARIISIPEGDIAALNMALLDLAEYFENDNNWIAAQYIYQQLYDIFSTIDQNEGSVASATAKRALVGLDRIDGNPHSPYIDFFIPRFWAPEDLPASERVQLPEDTAVFFGTLGLGSMALKGVGSFVRSVWRGSAKELWTRLPRLRQLAYMTAEANPRKIEMIKKGVSEAVARSLPVARDHLKFLSRSDPKYLLSLKGKVAGLTDDLIRDAKEAIVWNPNQQEVRWAQSAVEDALKREGRILDDELEYLAYADPDYVKKFSVRDGVSLNADLLKIADESILKRQLISQRMIAVGRRAGQVGAGLYKFWYYPAMAFSLLGRGLAFGAGQLGIPQAASVAERFALNSWGKATALPYVGAIFRASGAAVLGAGHIVRSSWREAAVTWWGMRKSGEPFFTDPAHLGSELTELNEYKEENGNRLELAITELFRELDEQSIDPSERIILKEIDDLTKALLLKDEGVKEQREFEEFLKQKPQGAAFDLLGDPLLSEVGLVLVNEDGVFESTSHEGKVSVTQRSRSDSQESVAEKMRDIEASKRYQGAADQATFEYAPVIDRQATGIETFLSNAGPTLEPEIARPLPEENYDYMILEIEGRHYLALINEKYADDIHKVLESVVN